MKSKNIYNWKEQTETNQDECLQMTLGKQKQTYSISYASRNERQYLGIHSGNFLCYVDIIGEQLGFSDVEYPVVFHCNGEPHGFHLYHECSNTLIGIVERYGFSPSLVDEIAGKSDMPRIIYIFNPRSYDCDQCNACERGNL